jgi:hypothetical protein
MHHREHHHAPTPRRQGAYDDTGISSYWRAYPAEMFNEELQAEVREWVGQIGTTMDEWKAAIHGDASAAVMLALRMRMPTEITVPLDVTMTVLLAASFEDTVAASVMGDLLQRAPLDAIDRVELSTSWLLHKIWQQSAANNARRRRRPFQRDPNGPSV